MPILHRLPSCTVCGQPRYPVTHFSAVKWAYWIILTGHTQLKLSSQSLACFPILMQLLLSLALSIIRWQYSSGSWAPLMEKSLWYCGRLRSIWSWGTFWSWGTLWYCGTVVECGGKSVTLQNIVLRDWSSSPCPQTLVQTTSYLFYIAVEETAKNELYGAFSAFVRFFRPGEDLIQPVVCYMKDDGKCGPFPI